jgi:hypothetical protein
MALAGLVFASSELLGWEELRVWEPLAGLSDMSTEPSRRLGELAGVAAARPDTGSSKKAEETPLSACDKPTPFSRQRWLPT